MSDGIPTSALCGKALNCIGENFIPAPHREIFSNGKTPGNFLCYTIYNLGLSSVVERLALIPHVGGSNPPAPARPVGIRDIQAAMALIIVLVLIEFEKISSSRFDQRDLLARMAKLADALDLGSSG